MIVNTQGAGDRLGVSSARVRKLIAAGRLPAKRLGREWYLDTKDIRRFRRRPPGRPKKLKEQTNGKRRRT